MDWVRDKARVGQRLTMSVCPTFSLKTVWKRTINKNRKIVDHTSEYR